MSEMTDFEAGKLVSKTDTCIEKGDKRDSTLDDLELRITELELQLAKGKGVLIVLAALATVIGAVGSWVMGYFK